VFLPVVVSRQGSRKKAVKNPVPAKKTVRYLTLVGFQAVISLLESLPELFDTPV